MLDSWDKDFVVADAGLDTLSQVNTLRLAEASKRIDYSYVALDDDFR